MWTLYDIHTDRYWNEQRHCWCAINEATLYTVEERNQVPLRSIETQWKFVASWFRSSARLSAC